MIRLACRIARVVAFTSIFLAVLAESAFGQTQLFSETGLSASDSDSPGVVFNGDRSFVLETGESACCTVSGSKGGGTVNVTPIYQTLGGNMTFRVDLDTRKFNGETEVEDSGTFTTQCFLAPTSLQRTPAGNNRIGVVVEISSETASIDVTCTETSMAVGYNTSVSDFNFLEIQNDLRNDITVSYLLNSQVDTSISSTGSFAISSLGRRDLDIHSLTGAGQFGRVLIGHDGPPNSVNCILAQYSNSNSGFTPTVRDECRSRGPFSITQPLSD